MQESQLKRAISEARGLLGALLMREKHKDDEELRNFAEGQAEKHTDILTTIILQNEEPR